MRRSNSLTLLVIILQVFRQCLILDKIEWKKIYICILLIYIYICYKVILINELNAVAVFRVWAWRVSAAAVDPNVRAIWGSPSAATAQVATALVPNAVTGHAAQISVVAQNRAVRAVHASEVAVVRVRTYLAAYQPVSAVALDRRVWIRRAHVAAATARSDGLLVLNVPRYAFVVVFAIVKTFVLILVV